MWYRPEQRSASDYMQRILADPLAPETRRWGRLFWRDGHDYRPRERRLNRYRRRAPMLTWRQRWAAERRRTRQEA